MLALTAIGVYHRNDAYGLWGQVKVPVGDKTVTLDIELTGPTLMYASAANNIARDVFAQLADGDVEFLPF